MSDGKVVDRDGRGDRKDVRVEVGKTISGYII